MYKTSVISILKSLTKDELKEFNKFIVSPFFNNQPSLTKFYLQLRKFHPEFTGDNINRTVVFQKLYPGKPYSDTTIRRLCSDLKKVLDDYIYYKAGERSQPEAGFLKAMEYLRRGIVNEAKKELELINKTLEGQVLLSHEYIKNRLEYEDLTVQIGLSTNRQQSVADNFINEIEFLIYNFILRFAYYIHNINANKLIFNLEEKSFIQDFISSLDFEKIALLIGSEKSSKGVNKAMRIYILITLNNLYEAEEKYFTELKQLLPEAITYFNDPEKYNIYQLAEAICWRKMETINREKYRRELFEINKLRLEAGVFSPDGKNIRLMFYRQVFMSAIQLKEYSWAENFVNEYSEKLPPDIKDNMKKFAEAHILFEKGEYNLSLSQLTKVDFEIFTLKYDLRNLMLRIYIELNYIEEALSLIDSYKRFITNNKNVSAYYRQITNNFLKYCKNIISLKNGKSRLTAAEIQSELENENAVNFKPWLIEKLHNSNRQL